MDNDHNDHYYIYETQNHPQLGKIHLYERTVATQERAQQRITELQNWYGKTAIWLKNKTIKEAYY